MMKATAIDSILHPRFYVVYIIAVVTCAATRGDKYVDDVDIDRQVDTGVRF